MQFFMTTRVVKEQKGPIVKRLLIRCPSTAKLTPSGQTIKVELWAAAKIKSHKMTCAHCQQVHTWTKKDVVLDR